MQAKGQLQYFSLDDARRELHQRWGNVELRRHVEAFLGDRMYPGFDRWPRAFVSRFIASPDNGIDSFLWRCRYLNAPPLIGEYVGDTFLKLNPEKRGLGRLQLSLAEGGYCRVNIMDFNHQEKLPICDVVTKHGERLVDFHHRLWRMQGCDADVLDMTMAWKSLGKPIKYYVPFLAHFIAHGVIFENFLADEGEPKHQWCQDVLFPVLDTLQGEFGMGPIVVRMYPEHQTDDEDLFWWSYPKLINDYLLQFVREKGYTLVKDPWRHDSSPSTTP